ncbi:hypothetical protein HYH03_018258 [Edaphochlamys debaryana]|uniref:Uncharacterized protein n=1 Tax=Edaphochlamys debaryana TaxID=47281 RepID=A0A836BNG0_9CHLO|nr:hypothetical protein HYH03_018258 [Edaphochlamys debaryana]|eukprot:KAG2482817.1 hypothetical protein HYH03_018258 [Edaphochlamys debaryana]
MRRTTAAPKADLLTLMLRGPKALGARPDGDSASGVVDEARPSKRPCLASALGSAPTASAAASLPLERRGSLPCQLLARSIGSARPSRSLWLDASPRLVQAGRWDAAARLRPGSVAQQDAATHIELSSADGVPRLAVAQANQMVRIVPAEALRAAAEAAHSRRQRQRHADGPTSPGASSDESDDGDVDEEANEDGARGPGRSPSDRPTPRRPGASARARGSCSAAAAAPLLPWEALVDAARTGGCGGAVLTLRTHQHVAALGWDPRRPGRLAMVDRASPSVTLLDLGAGGPQGQGGTDFRRSYLTAAPEDAGGGVAVFGAARGGGGGGAAARSLTYLSYGTRAAPYTLAAAGRSGGDGAVVHLWDERRGRAPVSRLGCPGGAALVAPLEPSQDGTALLGVVHPGTLVLWDVRRASSSLGGGALLSLGSAAPPPSAVVAARELLGPLAAAGCWRPVVSSLAADPGDSGRVALLTQDGSSALMCLASGAITHARPAPLPYDVARMALSSLTSTNPNAATGLGSRSGSGSGASAMGAAVPLLSSGPSGAGARAGPEVGPGRHQSATEVCSLVGGLRGAWDPDACGFWHPAAFTHPSARIDGTAAAAAAGREGDAGYAALCAALGPTTPGLVLSDFRPSRGIRGSRGAVPEPASAAAGSRPPPSAAVGVTRVGLPQAAVVGVGGPPGSLVPARVASASSSAVAVGSVGPAVVAAAAAAAAAEAPAAAVAAALADWPVCVTCLPFSGDVVCGTLGGQLMYWRKG